MKKYTLGLKEIKELNPCQGRLDNFIEFYGKRRLTKGQFMGLKNITQCDKMWVAFRLMPKDNVRFAAADIAESVLSSYESKYPNDLRPRKAIEAARSNKSRAIKLTSAFAAYAAANAANATYAADAAYVAASAAYAAASAAANASATYAASAAADARNIQGRLNRKIVLKYWR